MLRRETSEDCVIVSLKPRAEIRDTIEWLLGMDQNKMSISDSMD